MSFVQICQTLVLATSDLVGNAESVTQVLLLNADVAVGYTWPRLMLSISAIVQSLASLALLPDSRARALLISAGRIQILANHSYGHFRSHK